MTDKLPHEQRRPGLAGCLITVVMLLFSCALLLSSCVSRVEVTRLASPDGVLVARVTEINGGATTDFAYRVDVSRDWPVRWSQDVAYYYGAGRSECAYGVNVAWAGNNDLIISYLDAQSADIIPSVRVAGRTVRIISKSGVDDPSAPCGGVEYSQRRGT